MRVRKFEGQATRHPSRVNFGAANGKDAVKTLYVDASIHGQPLVDGRLRFSEVGNVVIRVKFLVYSQPGIVRRALRWTSLPVDCSRAYEEVGSESDRVL